MNGSRPLASYDLLLLVPSLRRVDPWLDLPEGRRECESEAFLNKPTFAHLAFPDGVREGCHISARHPSGGVHHSDFVRIVRPRAGHRYGERGEI